MELSCISHPLSLVALPGPLVLLVSRLVAISQCLLREPQWNQIRQAPNHHYKRKWVLDFLIHSPKSESVLHELLVKAQQDSKEQR